MGDYSSDSSSDYNIYSPSSPSYEPTLLDPSSRSIYSTSFGSETSFEDAEDRQNTTIESEASQIQLLLQVQSQSQQNVQSQAGSSRVAQGQDQVDEIILTLTEQPQPPRPTTPLDGSSKERIDLWIENSCQYGFEVGEDEVSICKSLLDTEESTACHGQGQDIETTACYESVKLNEIFLMLRRGCLTESLMKIINFIWFDSSILDENKKMFLLTILQKASTKETVMDLNLGVNAFISTMKEVFEEDFLTYFGQFTMREPTAKRYYRIYNIIEEYVNAAIKKGHEEKTCVINFSNEEIVSIVQNEGALQNLFLSPETCVNTAKIAFDFVRENFLRRCTSLLESLGFFLPKKMKPEENEKDDSPSPGSSSADSSQEELLSCSQTRRIESPSNSPPNSQNSEEIRIIGIRSIINQYVGNRSNSASSIPGSGPSLREDSVVFSDGDGSNPEYLRIEEGDAGSLHTSDVVSPLPSRNASPNNSQNANDSSCWLAETSINNMSIPNQIPTTIDDSDNNRSSSPSPFEENGDGDEDSRPGSAFDSIESKRIRLS